MVSENHSEYEELAQSLGETYTAAISARNVSPEMNPNYEVRSKTEELHRQITEDKETAKELLRREAEKVDEVETGYIVSDGWELYHNDPEDLPDNLVFACRLYDSIINAWGELNQLLSDEFSWGGIDDYPQAADNVAYSFSHIQSRMDMKDISIPNVDAE